MYSRRPRKFRRRSNGRNYQQRGDGDFHLGPKYNSFSKGPVINYSKTTQNVEKLVEKYKDLAKESLSSGDIILSENYSQHADHYARIIEEKNKNKDQNRVQVVHKPIIHNKNLSENSDVNQNKTVEEKEEKK